MYQPGPRQHDAALRWAAASVRPRAAAAAFRVAVTTPDQWPGVSCDGDIRVPVL